MVLTEISFNWETNLFKNYYFSNLKIKLYLSFLVIFYLIRLFLRTKFRLFCHFLCLLLFLFEMKEIHKLTEIFYLWLWEHKFKCLHTFFCFKICQHKISMIVFSQIILSYSQEVYHYCWSEITLIDLFLISRFDKIKFFNLLSYG